MKHTVAVIVFLAVIGLLLCGCASPEQRAQKLFDQGKYEEVLAKYATTPVAEQAKEKVAEKLFTEGKYDDVVKTFMNTSFGPKAQAAIDEQSAKKMLDAKDLQGVITKYPNSQAALQARNALAEQLFTDKKNWDELLAKYPSTPAAMKARNELAKGALDKIMKMHTKNTVKAKALDDFIKNPKYAGSQSIADAQAELARINTKAATKKK
jgi:hypothetical protein